MAVSLRYYAGINKMKLFLAERAIENQPTVRIPSLRKTEQLPPMEFYLFEERFPLLQVRRAVECWMKRHTLPPRCICLPREATQRYYEAQMLSIYYYRFPDGHLWPVELLPRDLPEKVVWCCATRP